MFCEYCGKKLEDNEFCLCPGAKSARGESSDANDNNLSAADKAKSAIENFASTRDSLDDKLNNLVSEENIKIASEKISATSTQVAEKARGKKKYIIVGGIALLIVILAVVFVFSRPEKVDLASYIDTEEIEAIGFDGHAVIYTDSIYADYALENDIYDLATGNVDKISEDELENLDEEEVLEALGSAFMEDEYASEIVTDVTSKIKVTYKVNDENVKKLMNLSNGDIVTICISTGDYMNKDLGIKLVDGEVTYEVSGLETGKEYDLFSDKIEFYATGGNSYGYIEGQWKVEDTPADFEFNIKNNGTYSNGDVVKIWAEYDIEDLTEAGYYLKEEFFKYEVKGLQEYVLKPEQMVEPLKSDLIDAALAEMNDSFTKIFIGADGDVSFDSMYIGVSKKGASNFYDNEIYVWGKYKSSGKTVYAQVSFGNVMVNDDGTYSVDGKAKAKEIRITASGNFSSSDMKEFMDNNEGFNFIEVE